MLWLLQMILCKVFFPPLNTNETFFQPIINQLSLIITFHSRKKTCVPLLRYFVHNIHIPHTRDHLISQHIGHWSLETVRYDKELGHNGNSDVFRVPSSGEYSYLTHFQIALFTMVVLIICLVTEMIDWKQKNKNQWVQIEKKSRTTWQTRHELPRP